MDFANGGKHDPLIVELLESGRLIVDLTEEPLPAIFIHDRRLHEIRPATIRPNHDGYPCVKLRVGARTVRLRCHRIVWVAAHGVKDRTLELDHGDTDRKNYRLDNLSLVTRRENELRKQEARYWREQYEAEIDTPATASALCDDLPF